MKTPEEIFDEYISPAIVEQVMSELDAAGYHITANLPPNSAAIVIADERGHVVQYKPHGETQETRQSED